MAAARPGRRPVRRPREPSDAFVFFGATGDLAYKQVFPALAGLVRDEGLDMPIIGVARSGDLDSLRKRARQNLQAHGFMDAAATWALTDHLQYVKGSDDDIETFHTLRRAPGEARHPLHYLAVPPALFGEVVTNLEARDPDPRRSGRSATLSSAHPFEELRVSEKRPGTARASGDHKVHATESEPDPASDSGPEPSLATRMARADMKDAFETGVPPFDTDSRPDAGANRESDTSSDQPRSPAAIDLGGRVNAARATYGRSGRVGIAAAGGPVQSVGAGMLVPKLPTAAGVPPVADPDSTSDEIESHDEGRD